MRSRSNGASAARRLNPSSSPDGGEKARRRTPGRPLPPARGRTRACTSRRARAARRRRGPRTQRRLAEEPGEMNDLRREKARGVADELVDHVRLRRVERPAVVAHVLRREEHPAAERRQKSSRRDQPADRQHLDARDSSRASVDLRELRHAAGVERELVGRGAPLAHGRRAVQRRRGSPRRAARLPAPRPCSRRAAPVRLRGTRARAGRSRCAARGTPGRGSPDDRDRAGRARRSPPACTAGGRTIGSDIGRLCPASPACRRIFRFRSSEAGPARITGDILRPCNPPGPVGAGEPLLRVRARQRKGASHQELRPRR